MSVTSQPTNGIAQAGPNLVCAPDATLPPVTPMIFKSGVVTEIPASVPDGTTSAHVDLDLSAGDFDATSLPKPTGLIAGGMLQITKADTGPNKIKFTKPLAGGPKTYCFGDRGDILCLECDGQGGWCISG